MKTLTINGQTFEVINKRDKQLMKQRVGYIVEHFEGETIYTAYTNPSSTKVRIYESWREWSAGVEGLHCFEVSGHNSMTFSLHGIYQPSWEETYIVEITPAHNRLLKVS